MEVTEVGEAMWPPELSSDRQFDLRGVKILNYSILVESLVLIDD